MSIGDLGKMYSDGETIVRQGEIGDSMFVIVSGEVKVIRERLDGAFDLSILKSGDVFGEMALFTREPRSATVRALGQARVLTLDRRTFLRRVHEDPSLAFRILQQMSARIRGLNHEIAELRAARDQSVGEPDPSLAAAAVSAGESSVSNRMRPPWIRRR